ncbi:helix-turn-helix domain-containing protein [Flavobacterium sp. NRK F10]|uniref:helix-turn-helix domain-containing protein n=1 Tax=Flavobacterium sp. NRK F10 TaxID=2954931 RepID=UPI002090DE76|nr:helix-turn-helix transcriptional regulator [Flavobacterium sp. NRK F10]MCO6175381.1 helix-turn-helix domain-containing protein [Flavobacterium sp. NRK F10]
MSFGKRLTEVRKSKNLSQEDLAKHLGTKSPVIGRYERDEMKPSIDTANKLADFLEVSLDYLTGNTDVLLDTNTLNRILEVQQLPEDVKEKLFYFIDMTIRDYKAKQAYK